MSTEIYQVKLSSIFVLAKPIYETGDIAHLITIYRYSNGGRNPIKASMVNTQRFYSMIIVVSSHNTAFKFGL